MGLRGDHIAVPPGSKPLIFMGGCCTATPACLNLDLSLRLLSGNAYKASIWMPEREAALRRACPIHWTAWCVGNNQNTPLFLFHIQMFLLSLNGNWAEPMAHPWVTEVPTVTLSCKIQSWFKIKLSIFKRLILSSLFRGRHLLSFPRCLDY